jgi:hypothetical protein
MVAFPGNNGVAIARIRPTVQSKPAPESCLDNPQKSIRTVGLGPLDQGFEWHRQSIAMGNRRTDRGILIHF